MGGYKKRSTAKCFEFLQLIVKFNPLHMPTLSIVAKGLKMECSQGIELTQEA